jgi:alpha-D-xyloside xylohydrolase
MRFGDGAWRLLPGVTPNYLSRVDGARIGPDELVLHVSNRLETARWATLEGHMFTLRITSPADEVARIRVAHHLGRKRKGPDFELRAEPRALAIGEDDEAFALELGRLKLVIRKQPFGIEFWDTEANELITTSPFKGLAMMEKPGDGLFLRDQLTLRPGELVYGLGERFSAFPRNGQTVDMWNADCGTCSDKGYKDVPFFLTSRGWGVFVNSSDKVSFEIGTEQVMRAQFAVPGEDLDYFLIRGPEPKGVLRRLAELSGKPALPPVWSFGLWLTTSFTTEYDERTVTEQIDGMFAREIPLHVFHFDCFWMKGHHWCNFEWDEAVFPDPRGMLERLHAKGLHLCVWINPYIAERSRLFEEGTRRGFLLRRPNGDVYQRPKWQAGMGYVDFTNPDAVRWYQDELRRLVRMGVDAFKTDFGEEIPTDVVYFDGSDPERMHNYYTLLYNRAVFEVLVEERGEREAVVFARSATATCQRFPVHWGGDCYGSYASMAETLRGGLSLALSGFGFWSHDIGGFEDKAPAGVYKRWVAFGLLSSHSRLHGSSSYRVPWIYDEEAVDVVRFFSELKCRLMPYVMRAATEAQKTGVPLMRPMLLEYPKDPSCRTLDRQYLLGGELLVAPVFDDRRAEFYLPAGEWTHLLTGEVRSGGGWFFDELDFLAVPVFIRPNALLAMGAERRRVDYDYAENPRLVCGKLDGESPSSVEIVDRLGNEQARFELEQRGKKVTLRRHGSAARFELQLPWARSVSELSGGRVLEASELSTAVPGDPGGVVIQATGDRLSFVWV